MDFKTLSSYLFWDVNPSEIDFDKNFKWVIVRVFNRGDVEDIRQIRRFYGDDKIKEVLLHAKDLSFNRIHLASAVLNEPLNNFKCYTTRQLNPGLYPY
jgi:hypothetical protein